MGLALLSDTVETIGGRLTVMSAPGRGTTVRLLLPLPQ
jgi:signal transduction histidine kinase